MNDNIKNQRSRSPVGLAMEEALHSDAVARTLSRSGQFDPIRFDLADVQQGIWPPGPFAAVVASPKAHGRRLRERLAGPIRSPVILALERASYGSSRAQMLHADSFVLIDSMLPLLPRIITLSQHGLAVLPPHARSGELRADPRLGRLDQLSGRDRAVLGALSNGQSNDAIADRLGISVAGTKMHIRRIVDSLDFKNRTDAALFAAMLSQREDAT